MSKLYALFKCIHVILLPRLKSTLEYFYALLKSALLKFTQSKINV